MSDKLCPTCKKDCSNKRGSKVNACDLCQCWYHNACEKIEDKIHQALNSAEGVKMIFWYCSKCRTSTKPLIDKIQELTIHLNETKKDLTEEISRREALQETVSEEAIKRQGLDDTVNRWEARIEALEQKENKSGDELKTYAAAAVETFIKDNQGEQTLKTYAETVVETYIKEYPALGEQTQKIDLAVKESQETRKQLGENMVKQKEDIEELNRRRSREKNLILYNLVEDEKETTEQLMLADFEKLVNLYSGKVEIIEEDITAICRLGERKENKSRPLRITFRSEAKRREILRNNKNLILEREELPICSRCEGDTKHIHVYVSIDRTIQQRDKEKALRAELKRRKNAGEGDLVIRNEKIVPFRPMAQPSWATVYRG